MAVILVSLNLILIVAMLIPAKAEVTEARYQITPAFPFFPGAPAAPPGQNLSMVAASATVEISKRIIGQSISFREIIISDESGNEIERVEVDLGAALAPGTGASVQIQRQLEVEISGPDGTPIINQTPEPVTGRVVLYPFEKGTIAIQLISPGEFNIEAGSELRIEIIGKSGLRRFRARGTLTPLIQAPPPQS